MTNLQIGLLRGFLSTVGASCVAAGLSPAALAQEASVRTEGDASSAQAGDILVTAERRETRLQDTPIAITAFSARQLAEQNLDTARDLAGRIPNVIIPRTFLTQSSQSFFIRGLGENDPTADPAVGVYVDDVYIPRLFGVLADFGDAERVEVLRGPQGTLYGRNTSGGAIRVITRDPDNALTGRAEVGGGNRGQFEAHGYVSGPLVTDKVYASLAVSHRQHDGYVFNRTLDRRVNDEDVTALRAKLRFTPTEALDIQITADNSWDTSTSMARIPRNQPGGYDPAVTYAEFSPDGEVKAGGVSLRSIYALSDALKFKSITSWRYFHQDPMAQDGDGEALGKSTNVNRYNQNAFTQEFQLLGNLKTVNFVLGGFLFHENYRSRRNTFTNTYIGSLPRLQDSDVVTDSAALFGQATVDLGARFSLVGGLRFTHDHRRSDYTLYLDDAGGVPQSVLFNVKAKKSWNALTPKIGLNFKASRDILLYVDFSRGFKSGGFDRSSSSATDAASPFGPEKVSAYEGGIKSSFLGGALVANIAGFYNHIDGLQASIFVPSTSTFRRGNAGTARSYGFELETVLAPVEAIQWRNSAGYTNARYTRFPEPSGPGTDASGNKIAFTPDWTLNSELTLAPKLAIPGQVRLIGSVQYQSRSFADVLNTPQARLPRQTFVNGSVSYRTADRAWTFSLVAKNIFDRRAAQFAAYSSTLNYVSNSDPRTIIGTVAYSF